MASINYATREISCKIVYYGPGLSGKTTNLQIIHRKIPDKDKSEMVSLATETDRTLFFDFLPLDLGSIKGFSTKFQLYTVPGQVYYNATRKLVLRGVDGVVFVVDSQVDKLQENLESFANLQENLREYGHSIENIPMVLQYNKRDLPNVYPLDQLNSLVNKHRLPYYEAVAATGVGVFTTLKAIGKSVIDKFNAKYAGFQGASGRRPARPEAPSAPAPQPPAGFGAPAPQPPPQRDPLRTPPSPNAGFGGFASGPAQPGSAPGFPGGPAAQPFQPPQPPGFRPNVNSPAPGPVGGGFPGPAQNPFQGNPPFGAPQGGAPQGGGFPGPTAPGNNPFPPQPPKPGFPPAFQPGAPSSPQFPFPGPKQPGPMPGPQPNQGFAPPGGNIPVSPFVESFGGGKPGFGNPPGPSMPPSAPGNPFGSAPGAPGPGFGQNKPFPPGSQNPNAGPGAFTGFPQMPGQAPNPGFGNIPGQQPGSPFPSPKPPGAAFPPPGQGMNPPMQQFPQQPAPPQGPVSGPGPASGPGQPRGPGGGQSYDDNSGIVSTYEDMAKDENFKTRKLPHPKDGKKGFFDGLFKKEK